MSSIANVGVGKTHHSICFAFTKKNALIIHTPIKYACPNRQERSCHISAFNFSLNPSIYKTFIKTISKEIPF